MLGDPALAPDTVGRIHGGAGGYVKLARLESFDCPCFLVVIAHVGFSLDEA